MTKKLIYIFHLTHIFANRSNCALTLLFCCAGLLNACHLNSTNKENYLIVAVDQLSAEQVRCSQEFAHSQEQASGFEILCREAIRYTHAHTTSTMSGPALASLLSGQYPFEHQLHHNGGAIKSDTKTFAKSAHEQGYATGFFSGGAPILRKLNLNIGFDTFDDHIQLSPNSLYRNLEKNLLLFNSWQKENSNKPFVAIIYSPDLGMIDPGRNTQLESELEIWDNHLGNWIQQLKQNKLWDQTNFILVGLNGHDDQSREGELLPQNLYGEHTQVPLFIKPARKPADEGLHWTFDANVSLADVGKTLIEKLGHVSEQPESAYNSLPILSLSNSWLGPIDNKILKQFDRPILIESHWGAWQDTLAPRYAIRWNQYLIILDKQIKIYNSLIDRYETTPLRSDESSISTLLKNAAQILSHTVKTNTPPYELPNEKREKWQLISEYFLNKSINDKQSAIASKLINEKDLMMRDFYSLSLIEKKSWEQLQTWAKKIHSSDLEHLSELILHAKENKPVLTAFENACLKIAENSTLQNILYKDCDDNLALSYFEDYKSEKDSQKKKFLRSYLDKKIDEKIGYTNLALQAPWDVGRDSAKLISYMDLILLLPEQQKNKTIIHRALGLQ